jgi:hypothetical protein
MAKATASLTTPAIQHNPAVATATAEIVALINSRPASPRQDEIAAIIARALSAQDMSQRRTAYLASDWHRIITAYRQASGAVQEALDD